MFNMFVVVLAPSKSHCYLKKIYFTADTAKSKSEADLLDLISQNRDIVYTQRCNSDECCESYGVHKIL